MELNIDHYEKDLLLECIQYRLDTDKILVINNSLRNEIERFNLQRSKMNVYSILVDGQIVAEIEPTVAVPVKQVGIIRLTDEHRLVHHGHRAFPVPDEHFHLPF
jgi:hypothetical protein